VIQRNSQPARRRALAALAAGTLLGGLSPLRAALAPIRIGQSLPLTGPLGAVVKPIAEGQKALLDELNAEGGVRGATVELLTLDDSANPEQTASNTRRLIEDEKVTALFGYAFVPGLVRALPLANEKGVPLLGVYNGADIVRADNRCLFTTTASLADEVAAMVRNLASLNTRKMALAFQNNELGRYMRPIVEAAVRQHDGSLVATVALAPDGSNAAESAQAIAARAPEAILLLAGGAPVQNFMKALPSSARVAVYALSLAGTTALLEQIGPAARGMAFTQVVPYPLRQTTPLTRRFGAAMAKAKLAPSYDRMWGYLNASVLVEALRRAGPNPNPAAVYAALERMTDVDIGGYRLSFGPTRHHGSSFVEITVVDHNGRFVR
jgi:branched-chain amino acid transport system substrate-binding protein